MGCGAQVSLAIGDDAWEGDMIRLKILIAVKRKNVGDVSAMVVFPNQESLERLSILGSDTNSMQKIRMGAYRDTQKFWVRL